MRLRSIDGHRRRFWNHGRTVGGWKYRRRAPGEHGRNDCDSCRADLAVCSRERRALQSGGDADGGPTPTNGVGRGARVHPSSDCELLCRRHARACDVRFTSFATVHARPQWSSAIRFRDCRNMRLVARRARPSTRARCAMARRLVDWRSVLVYRIYILRKSSDHRGKSIHRYLRGHSSGRCASIHCCPADRRDNCDRPLSAAVQTDAGERSCKRSSRTGTDRPRRA